MRSDVLPHCWLERQADIDLNRERFVFLDLED